MYHNDTESCLHNFDEILFKIVQDSDYTSYIIDQFYNTLKNNTFDNKLVQRVLELSSKKGKRISETGLRRIFLLYDEESILERSRENFNNFSCYKMGGRL